MIRLTQRCLTGLLLLFAALSVQAADYRAAPQGKLEAARKYADDFLKEDAKPGQQFFLRQPKFPVWKDQPVIDCAMYAIMRAIQTRAPYFEDKKQTVVIVPVWVELLMLHLGENTGYPFGKDEEGVVQCKFEYEHYSFATKRFEKIPDLLSKPYLETFKAWGQLVPRTEVARGGNVRDLAIDFDKRYVRFNFRVSVAREAPYQLYPQFPRHHPTMPSIERIEWAIRLGEDLLQRGVSDRDSHASGERLAEDLARMRWQLSENKWTLEKLRQSVSSLQSTPSFSDLQLQ